jgi:hypothetical protein
MAVEREHERQRELDQRRALREAAIGTASDADRTTAGRRGLPLRSAALLRQLAGVVAAAISSALDRPPSGSHHL